MDKRTLFALILILVVFWISSEYIWKPNQPISHQKQAQKTSFPKSTVQDSEQKTPIENTIADEDMQGDIPINNEIILETDKMRLSFSNQGAVLHSIILKDYFLEDKKNLVQLIPAEDNILGMSIQDRQGNVHNLSNHVFQYSLNEEDIIFSAKGDFGYLEKRFFLNENYQLEMQLKGDEFAEMDGYKIAFDSGIADTEKYLKRKNDNYQVNFQLDNEQEKLKLSKLAERKELNGNIDWAVVKSKYFMMGIIPEERIDTNQLSAFQKNNSPAMQLQIEHQGISLDHYYKIYLGPIIYENLENYGVGIEKVVEMGPGFLQWLTKIFRTFLSFLHGFIPSWGLTIIIFAIILKIILYPLTHKSFESTTKMQKVQPLMKEIQDKYKGDPKKMNEELRKLYKEQGFNPLGGCLPMLLQMPVIFALYPILRYSLDLRQAGFLWLPDLSEPDPIWALPIAMALFMFVQQKLMAPARQNTEEMDEKQKAQQQTQKMMMYGLPVMMFFIFKGLSSGLVLYWTVFSVIGSIQQIFIKKKFSKEN